MKKYLSGIIFLVVSVISVPSFAQPEIYTLDPDHSYVEWHISHFGFSHPSGKWWAKGTLALDKAKPQDSKVNVTIDVKNMVTGNPKLDEHLSSVDFFDVAKYPTATFVSDKVVKEGKDTAKVYGTLTLKGISKPVILNVKMNKMDINPISDKPTAGFTATTEIKRSDFGITTLTPALGDDVKLTIEVEANKNKA